MPRDPLDETGQLERTVQLAAGVEQELPLVRETLDPLALAEGGAALPIEDECPDDRGRDAEREADQHVGGAGRVERGPRQDKEVAARHIGRNHQLRREAPGEEECRAGHHGPYWSDQHIEVAVLRSGVAGQKVLARIEERQCLRGAGDARRAQRGGEKMCGAPHFVTAARLSRPAR